MTAHRRTASDVKLEINQAIDLTDNDDGSPGGATDETDDIDLLRCCIYFHSIEWRKSLDWIGQRWKGNNQ